MSTWSQDIVEERIENLKVIPAISFPSEELVQPLVDLLIDEGLPILEILNRSLPSREAALALRGRRDLMVGVGSIVNEGQVGLFAEAAFLIAPGYHPDLARAARRARITFIPGVATPSEILAATVGHPRTTLLKLFPAVPLGGLPYVRALLAPHGDAIEFIPTGGIDAENLEAWLAEPGVAAVGGSWLAPTTLLESRDWTEIRRRVRHAKDVAERCQSKA